MARMTSIPVQRTYTPVMAAKPAPVVAKPAPGAPATISEYESCENVSLELDGEIDEAAVALGLK